MYYDRLIGDFHWPGTLVEPSEALCNTLRSIAERGGDELYNGTLAIDFLEDLNRVGSIITAEDLRDYQYVSLFRLRPGTTAESSVHNVSVWGAGCVEKHDPLIRSDSTRNVYKNSY